MSERVDRLVGGHLAEVGVEKRLADRMMAATFAEAGDVKTAREIMDKEDDPLGQKKGKKKGKK